jgi:hypothetical protein
MSSNAGLPIPQRTVLEVATFAMRQLGELIELFKANYERRWHNKRVQS